MPPRKKQKLDTDWTWAGLEADSVDEITADHRRRGAGLVGLKACKLEHEVDGERNGNGEKNGESSKGGGKAGKDLGCTAKLCKGNPRCYNHLGVEQTLGKKAKEEFIEAKMGQAPEQRDLSSPAGLRNMGATCYANAFLQLWFHNIEFRNGLYRCALIEGSKLSHLVKVFAALQYSRRKVVDPSGLVEALKLKTDDQQDAGEFSKLFMNVIEMELKRQKDPELRNLPERLFQGKLEYVTHCHGCNSKRRREEKFLELELSLKNNETLNDRLRALSHPETLTLDNQYHCSACHRKCDATRRLEIKELPQYLHFSLLRFTFDVGAGERRKSKAVIRYPRQAVFGGWGYELGAVVVHLGSSPYHGHFVTEVMDEQTKEWYTCNDEEISIRKPPSLLNKLGQPNDGLESTKDAYMLVYKRKEKEGSPDGSESGSVVELAPSSKSGRGKEEKLGKLGKDGKEVRDKGVNGNGNGTSSGSKDRSKREGSDIVVLDPPEEVMGGVREMNDRMEDDMREWVEKCQLAGIEFDTLKDIKEPVIASLSGEDKIIPRDELSRWLTADMAALETPISYAALSCSHSDPTTPPLRLDPTKMAHSRLISSTAFALIASTTPLPSAEICPICIEATFTQRISASDRIDQVGEFDRLNSTSTIPPADYGENDEPDLYLISKAFLDGWRKHTLSPEVRPSDPGYSLWCGHDKPWPADRAYALITPAALSLLHSALSDDFPLFTQSAPLCPSCSSSSVSDAEARIAWQAELKIEKPLKKEINLDNVVYDTPYYILPHPWLTAWRIWNTTPGPRPVWATDFCEHGLLQWDPAQDGDVDFVSQKGWEMICERYEVEPGEGVTMCFEAEVERGRKFQIGGVSRAVCEPCRRRRRLTWEETKIEVMLVEEGEVGVGKSEEGSRASSADIEIIPNGSSKLNSKPANGNGKSAARPITHFNPSTKRARSSRIAKQTTRKPLVLTITPDTTVKHVRSEIYETFHISPISQSVWYGDLELGDGGMTMRDIGMVSGGELKVVELKEDEGILEGKGGGGGQGEDGGFGGTALVGVGRQCPDCTFLDEVGGEGCTMCGRPFGWDGE